MDCSKALLSTAIAGTLAFPLLQVVHSQEAAPHSPATVSQAWDTLRGGTSHNDVEHRRTAVAAIGTIGPLPEAVRMIEATLRDKDASVRQTAAATLGQMGAKAAIPSLREVLDDNPEVSFTAAKALWDLGDTSGRGLFQQVLEGERTNAPSKLHGAVKDAKHKLQPGQLALMGAKEAGGVVLGPATLGIDAVQLAVKEAKKDTGAAGRSLSAEALAKDSDPYALTLLEWALGDDNWGVRVAVAKALGERGNTETIPKLEPVMLKDDHHEVRYAAAASIIKLNAKTAPAAD